MTTPNINSAGILSLDDVKLFVNYKEVPIDAPLVLLSGQTTTLELKSEALKETEVVLYNLQGGELVDFEPTYGILVTIINGVATWTINQVKPENGRLQLILASRSVPATLELDFRVLPSDLGEVADILLDEQPISPTRTYLTGGKSVPITLRHLNGDLLENVPLALGAALDPPLTDGDIIPEPPLNELTRKHEWELTPPLKDGSFKLQVYGRHGVPVLQTSPINIGGEYMFLVEYDSDTPLPNPYPWPNKYTLSTPCGVVLKNAKGEPLNGVKITVSHEMQDSPGDYVRTTTLGRATIILFNPDPEKPRSYEVSAVAALPGGDRKIKLLITAPGGGK